MNSPFSTRTSPVEGSTICSAASVSTSLLWIPSFLLYLYLPTLARSYLRASNSSELTMDLAFSTVGGSPGLSLLYISLTPSSAFLVLSFSNVLKRAGLSPNVSRISSFDPSPIALRNDVRGSFLVLSTLTYRTPAESVSYSSHAPLLGIIVEE